jgi:hypothetical protein
MNDFIPNSFQTPNAYVDRYMAFLTPEEWKVLTYMGRRIFGFNKREDNISCSQIMNGITAKDGHQLDYGTGLGEAATKNAIKNLIAFRLVIEVAPNNAHENKGPKYALQLDSSLVNDELIMERHNKKTGRENERMGKARAARQSNKPGSNEQTPAYPIDPPPPYPIEGGDALMDKAHNTQGNPDSNPKDSGAEAPSAPKESKKRERDTRLDHPAILLVRGVTNAYPPKASFAFVIDKLGATPDGPKFAIAYQTWCTRGNKPTNLEGIIDWYINGVPPQYKPAYGKAGTPAPANQPEADYTAEREAIKKATIAKRLAAREGQNANAQASPQ